MNKLRIRHFIQKPKERIRVLMSRVSLWIQLSVFITLIISGISFILIQKEYTSTRANTIHNLTDTTGKLLQLETTNMEHYLADLANFCILPRYDFKLSTIIEQQTPLTEEQLIYLREQMYYYRYTRNDIDDYHIFLKNQSLCIGRKTRQQHFAVTPYDPAEYESIYQDCSNSLYNQAIYPPKENSFLFTYYHTMIRIRDQAPQALVEIQVNRSILNQLLPNHSTPGELLLLLDRNGNLIYCSKPSLIPDHAALETIHDSKEGSTEGYTTVSISETPYLYIAASPSDSDFQLISLTPLSIIDSQIGRIRKSLFISGLLLTLAAVALINMLIHLLTNPLKVLSRQMERTGDGDFHSRVHANGSLEIVELSNSFNSMVSHIDELIRRTYLAELSEKNARLTALESQLNPHFLYNTLQAISTEALINDQPQIHKMITSLAASLRYTIKGGDLVPLRKEMIYVKDYIYLQKMRMDDNLTVLMDIDPSTEEFLIPKISIQTMVENSIIHGLRPETGSIEIYIMTRKAGDSIEISVRDNGSGITKEQLDNLYLDFEKQGQCGMDGGIGLVNLHTRLRLLYKTPAHMEIQSDPGHFTEILLTLPAVKVSTVQAP